MPMSPIKSATSTLATATPCTSSLTHTRRAHNTPRLDALSLAVQLRTSCENGLNTREGSTDAELRALLYGVNRLPPPKSASFLQLVLEALQVCVCVYVCVCV